MAGLLWLGDSGEVALAADTAKTVLQVSAPAQQRVLIHELRIEAKGTNPVGAPIKVRLLRQTTAGTMTALTLQKSDSTDDETIQATAQHTATVEPTAGAVLRTMELHPQASRVEQLARPLIVPGGTRLGIEVTSTQALSVAVGVLGEE